MTPEQRQELRKLAALAIDARWSFWGGEEGAITPETFFEPVLELLDELDARDAAIERIATAVETYRTSGCFDDLMRDLRRSLSERGDT